MIGFSDRASVGAAIELHRTALGRNLRRRRQHHCLLGCCATGIPHALLSAAMDTKMNQFWRVPGNIVISRSQEFAPWISCPLVRKKRDGIVLRDQRRNSTRMS